MQATRDWTQFSSFPQRHSDRAFEKLVAAIKVASLIYLFDCTSLDRMVYQDQLRIGRLECVSNRPNRLMTFIIPFPSGLALTEKCHLRNMVPILRDISDWADLGDTYMGQ
jgi:hypothetical protein